MSEQSSNRFSLRRKVTHIAVAGALAVASSLSMTGVAHAAAVNDTYALTFYGGDMWYGFFNVLDNDCSVGYLAGVQPYSGQLQYWDPSGTVCTYAFTGEGDATGAYITSTSDVAYYRGDI